MFILPLLILFLSISIFAEPILFQLDQVNYIYHDVSVNEVTLEKFHRLFGDYYSKTLEEFGAKKSYPLRVEIYTDVVKFRNNTGLASFTAGMFDPQTETFYFLLTAKTLQEDRLITVISHEVCHAAFNAKKRQSMRIAKSLEEGFCFLHYPSEVILNRDVSSYMKMNFAEFLILSEKNLASNDRKKREVVYLVSSWFVQFLSKEKNKEDVIILLDKDSQKNLEKQWQIFSRRKE